MKHALLILNPFAGRMKSKNGLFSVTQILSDADIAPTVYVTRGRGDATKKILEESNPYDLVICCGGDGTLNEVISGLLLLPPEKRLPLGYIPCGSTNDFAATLGLPLKLKDAAKAIAAGKTKKIDTGKFNEKYFSYVASFGAFTSVSYGTPQQIKNSLGHFAYILQGAKALGEIRPYEVEYNCDGVCGRDYYVFGAVSNTTSIGGVYELPKNEVSLSDGQFELILLKDGLYSPETLWNIVQRKLDRDDNIVFLHGKHIQLRSAEPISYTLDGEFGGSVTLADIHCLDASIDIFYKEKETQKKQKNKQEKTSKMD